jgi:Ca-activated chloride channel family protein
MKFSANFDFDVIALQQDETLTCLIQLEAPMAKEDHDRPAECLIPVLDRSGSMRGEPINACKQALHTLVDRMKPQDTFGLIAFDDQANIAVPARSMKDHDLATVHQLIESIEPGGTTDLSAGYLLGIDAAKRNLQLTGASLLLLSDGHVNAGIRDLTKIAELARSARTDRITSTTIGIGEGYDERLLAAIATHGSGNHRFAHTSDDAISILGEESGDLLNKSVINAFLRIVPNDPDLINRIGTLQDVPKWIETNHNNDPLVVIPLGDIYAGETRELLVQFHIPGIQSLGEHALGDFLIDFVTLPNLEQSNITWPICVNVGSVDQVKSRIPNPTVTTAMLITESAKVQREASEHLRRGNTHEATKGIQERLDHMSTLPNRELVEDEIAHLTKLIKGIEQQDANRMSKSLYEDSASNLRGRNRDQMRQARSRGKRDF